MSDPLEERLKALMQQAGEQSEAQDDERLGRVLHEAHLRSGLFDLLGLFTRWGSVISEAANRSMAQAELRDRQPASNRRSSARTTE